MALTRAKDSPGWLDSGLGTVQSHGSSNQLASLSEVQKKVQLLPKNFHPESDETENQSQLGGSCLLRFLKQWQHRL